MIASRNRLPRLSRLSGRKKRLLTVLLLTCTVWVTGAPAQPDAAHPEAVTMAPQGGQSGQPPRRPPPRIAIDACADKHEGDPCSFMDPDGVRSGECLSGREKIFACRPHRRDTTDEQLPEGRNRERAAQGSGSGQTVTAPPPMALKAGEKAAPEPWTKPAAQLQPAVRTANDTPFQPAAEHRPGSSLQSPPVALPVSRRGITDNPGSHLAVAMVAVALTWFGFYRHSTLPLRRLRRVTQQLAGGDLSARVGEGLVDRKNEVADLGRDVDRMAERIESLVGAHQRLIRDVSHELRSPLARLNVALELARQSAGSAHSAPFDRIQRESERLNELIGQLLMLTKLESDGSMNQRTAVDIAALVAEVAQDVDFEARSNDRRVVVTGCEQLQLNGNRELLRQALENLIRNAARYTAAGTDVEISLCKKESAGRSWAHIEVRDRGPGVPEAELYDIFRPFYRVNDARERQSGGVGVGLAISDRAVRLHGGSLRAFNAPGSGLLMEMELPLA